MHVAVKIEVYSRCSDKRIQEWKCISIRDNEQLSTVGTDPFLGYYFSSTAG